MAELVKPIVMAPYRMTYVQTPDGEIIEVSVSNANDLVKLDGYRRVTNAQTNDPRVTEPSQEAKPSPELVDVSKPTEAEPLKAVEEAPVKEAPKEAEKPAEDETEKKTATRGRPKKTDD